MYGGILCVGTHPWTDWVSFSNPEPEIIPNVWYPVALANRLTDTVLDPDTEEIATTFNSNFGQPGCVANQKWYYGLDNRANTNQTAQVRRDAGSRAEPRGAD